MLNFSVRMGTGVSSMAWSNDYLSYVVDLLTPTRPLVVDEVTGVFYNTVIVDGSIEQRISCAVVIMIF